MKHLLDDLQRQFEAISKLPEEERAIARVLLEGGSCSSTTPSGSRARAEMGSENTTDNATVGEASIAASETGAPVRSAVTQQRLDAAIEALNLVDVDEALRRRIAQRLF